MSEPFNEDLMPEQFQEEHAAAKVKREKLAAAMRRLCDRSEVAPSRSAAPKCDACDAENLTGSEYVNHTCRASAAPPSEREAALLYRIERLENKGGHDQETENVLNDVRRYLAGYQARAAVPQAAAFVQANAEYYRLASDMHDTAERIIKRVVTNVLSIAHTRNDLDDLAENDSIEKKEFVADGLGLALGEDTGCLDPDDLSAENCEVLFVEKELREFVARAAAVPAPGEAFDEENCAVCGTPESGHEIASQLHEFVCSHKQAIEHALKYAAGRWCEWGSRAESVRDILEDAVAGATAPPKENEND